MNLFALIAAASAAAAQPSAGEPVLRAGTPVPLEAVAEVTTRSHRQGDRVALQVAEDVMVGDRLAILKGAVALAEIAEHRARGRYGQGGRLELRLLTVTVDGRAVRLDGEAERAGVSATVPVVASAIVSGAIGAFISGKDGRIAPGTRLTGYIHRDTPLAAAAD